MRLTRKASTVACPACENYAMQLVDAARDGMTVQCMHCGNMLGTVDYSDGHWDDRLEVKE